MIETEAGTVIEAVTGIGTAAEAVTMAVVLVAPRILVPSLFELQWTLHVVIPCGRALLVRMDFVDLTTLVLGGPIPAVTRTRKAQWECPVVRSL